MSLIQYPVKNKQFTFVIVAMVITIGLSTLFSMPRAEDPETYPPQMPVVVVYPGTSPKDLEQLVVKPLETKISGMDDVKQIKSSIYNGLAVIMVEFEYDISYNDKYQELSREMDASRSQLPEGIYRMEVLKLDPTGVNVIQVALISENAPRDIIRKLANELENELEKVQTLKDVKIHGLSDPIVRVDINLERLAQLRIPLMQVVQAIQSEDSKIPAGNVHAGSNAYSIKTSGNFKSVEDIGNTIVTSKEGKNIVLADLANIYLNYMPENHITRLNGYRAVFVTAAQKKGQNISTTQTEYLKILSTFEQKLPNNVDMVLHFDQANNVNNRLRGLGLDFIIAVGLVLFTLLPLGTRASLVVMIAVPLSLSIGAIILNTFGYTLNQLSIVGFVVALGLVVDDSIVVVENIERWLRDGYSRMEAAIKGTQQIVLAVLGCTATLVIAFMPLLFLPEIAGDFIRSMPVVVIGSVIGSMFVALFVVPLLASILLKPHKDEKGNIFLQLIKKGIHLTYAVLLDKALKNPKISLLLAAVVFVGSLALIPKLGFSLFPSSEKPQFMVVVNAPPQSNIFHTDSLTKKIEKEIAEIPAVQYYASNIGKGNPRIYYNTEQKNEKSDFSEIFVQLYEGTSPKYKKQIIDSLRINYDNYPGAKIEIKDFEQGIPMIAPVEVRIIGNDLDTLKSLAFKTETILKSIPGAIYVNNPLSATTTDIKIDINKDKALSLGVPSVAIERTLRIALSGIDIGTMNNEDDDDFSIMLSVPRENHPDLSVIESLFVDNIEGTAIPLNHLVDLSFETSPPMINHIDKERTVSVSASVDQNYSLDKVLQQTIQVMDDFPFPDGYTYAMGGEIENRERSFGGFGTILMITLFFFVAVLILEFKTFKSTIIVLSVIPLGIVGAVIALLLTGNPLSFVAAVGLVALAGIEVKNTILLVDFTNQLRKEGMPLNEAIEKAGEMRFLPIILTTLTAIGGFLPIAWSNNPLISPLAIVMIGGLISSTLLSRIVTPLVYKLIPPKID